MSEHITHVAVYDDAVRLIHYSGRFTEAFKESTSKEFDSGFLASGTNGNHLWAVPLLEEFRDKYKAGDRSRETRKRIAAAIGWICHRAADLVVKPILANVKYEKHPVFNEAEQSAYYDAVDFREVFRGGRISITPYEPFSAATLDDAMKSHPASAKVDVGELEIPVSHFYLNEILRTHAFVNEQDDMGTWFDVFMESKQKFSEDLDSYINGFQRPDAAKMDKYLTNFRYYSPDDMLIRLLRSIQDGKPDKSIDLNLAIAAAANQGQYTKMVANAYTMLCYASDYFDGKVEKTAVYDVMNLEDQFRK